MRRRAASPHPGTTCMPESTVDLSLSAHEYRSYYEGRVRYIRVTTQEGVTVQFAAAKLAPFLTHEGIHGKFLLQYDETHKFVALKKL